MQQRSVLKFWRCIANGTRRSQKSTGDDSRRLEVIRLARQIPGRERCLDDATYDRIAADRYHVLAAVLWQMGRRREARRAFQQAARLDPQNSTLRRVYSAACLVLPHSAARTA